MASTINASLTAGLVTTADTTGNLNLQSGGATVVAVTSAGQALTGTFSATSYVGVGTTTPTTWGAFAVRLGVSNYYGRTVSGAFSDAVNSTLEIGHAANVVFLDTESSGVALKVQQNGTVITTTSSAGLAVTGTLSATTGAAVGGATAGAGGLAFPATAVAVTDANTLDDYEEGTWTPSLGGNTTYGTQVGKYTKIGRLVSVKFSLTVTTLGTGSTSSISGLPFTVGSMSDLQPGSVAYFQNLAANVTHINLYADDSSTTLGFATTGGNTSTASAASAIFGNSARIQGQITYNV